MDSRADFQKLLDDMDKVIQSKRQELSELDERLEASRLQLSQLEAEELTKATNTQDSPKAVNPNSISEKHEEKVELEIKLAKLEEEITEIESVNQELLRENNSFREELINSNTAIEKLQAKTLILTETLEEFKAANLELNLRLARAESDSSKQQMLLIKSQDQDEILLNALNDKLESMRRAIETRDEEIEKLRGEIKFTFDILGSDIENFDLEAFNQVNSPDSSQVSYSKYMSMMDSSKKSRIIELARAFQDKDSQINMLKDQLQQATRDLESNATILETLTKPISSIDGSTLGLGHPDLGQDIDSVRKRCESLEAEIEVKDKEFHLVSFRNRHLENVMPNMLIDLVNKLTKSDLSTRADTMNKIKELTECICNLLSYINSTQVLLNEVERQNLVIESKNKHIKQLVDELNRISANNEQVDQEKDPKILNQSRHYLSKKTTNLSDINETKSVTDHLDGQQNNRIIQTSELSTNKGKSYGIRTNSKSQENHLMNTTNNKPSDISGGTVKMSDYTFVECNSIAEETTTNNQATHHIETQLDGPPNQGRPNMNRSTNYSYDRQVHEKRPLSEEQKKNLENRLQQLENENQLLELAMKEILLSIKWSDSKCNTLLIDCPSLEKLCQLNELRMILSKTPSQEIANFIDKTKSDIPTSESEETNREPREIYRMLILKSELDLLRGQNEQLRVDAKLQRGHYQNIIKTLSDRLIENTSYSTSASLGVSQSAKIDSDVGCDDKGSANSAREVECQTEIIQRVESVEVKCRNCSRLTDLTRHLLKCIASIERRFQDTDQSYLNQLVTVHKFSRDLEKELSICENFLSDSRRQFHELKKQKLSTESRLKTIEYQVIEHMKICPIRNLRSMSPEMEVYTETKNGLGDYIQSFTITSKKGVSRQEKQKQSCAMTVAPVRGTSKMTITLLQSIISCLQARLDYKDERLRQLESLLSSGCYDFGSQITREMPSYSRGNNIPIQVP